MHDALKSFGLVKIAIINDATPLCVVLRQDGVTTSLAIECEGAIVPTDIYTYIIDDHVPAISMSVDVTHQWLSFRTVYVAGLVLLALTANAPDILSEITLYNEEEE